MEQFLSQLMSKEFIGMIMLMAYVIIIFYMYVDNIETNILDKKLSLLYALNDILDTESRIERIGKTMQISKLAIKYPELRLVLIDVASNSGTKLYIAKAKNEEDMYYALCGEKPCK